MTKGLQALLSEYLQIKKLNIKTDAEWDKANKRIDELCHLLHTVFSEEFFSLVPIKHNLDDILSTDISGYSCSISDNGIFIATKESKELSNKIISPINLISMISSEKLNEEQKILGELYLLNQDLFLSLNLAYCLLNKN